MTAYATDAVRTPPVRGVQWLWAVVAVAAAKWAFEAYIAHQQDFVVYLEAARRLIAEQPLYGPLDALPYTYPPLTAALFLPLAPLPTPVACVIWIGANAAAACWLLRRVCDGMPAAWIAVVALGAPIGRSLYLGQLNLMLFVLMWLSVSVSPTLLGGWRIGLAASLKITPAWLAVTYVVTRRWTSLGSAVLVAVLGVGIGYLAAPSDSLWYWTRGIWDVNRVGGGDYPDNQSLWGLINRISTDAPSAVPVVLTVVVIAAGLFAAYIHRGDAVLTFTSVGLAGVLGAPVSWSHHFFWLTVMVAVLWRAGRVRIAQSLAVAMLFEPIFMDGLVRHSPTLVHAFGASPYTLLAAASLGYLCLAAPRHGRDLAPRPGSRATAGISERSPTVTRRIHAGGAFDLGISPTDRRPARDPSTGRC